MSLILHCGAELQNEETAKAVVPTAKSKTHEPLGHGELIDLTRECLAEHGIEGGEGQYGLTPCGEDMFGFIELPVGTRLPAMEAQAFLLGMPVEYPRMAEVLVRAVDAGIMPTRLVKPLVKEWKKAENREHREAFQQLKDGNRLLQAFTRVNQKAHGQGGGHAGQNDFSILNRIAERSRRFTELLANNLDPDGSIREHSLRAQQLTFIDPEKSEDSRYVVGLRNSNRMRFAAGFLIGEAPFICDNLAFMGEAVVNRKHTLNIRKDLKPGIMDALDNVLKGDWENN